MSTDLSAALSAINWNSICEDFCKEGQLASQVEQGNLRLAVWSNQFEKIDASNPSIAFVREMQASGHHVASLIALGLYKPAAASMRAVLECSLYYVYFRRHLAELQTLVRDPSFFVPKSEIIEFYKIHVVDFSARQSALGFLGRLNKWYSKTSAIVHGQIPGVWTPSHSLGGAPFDAVKAKEVVIHFSEAISLVQDNFLCSLAGDLWGFFETDAKNFLLHGMSGGLKQQLGLNAA